MQSVHHRRWYGSRVGPTPHGDCGQDLEMHHTLQDLPQRLLQDQEEDRGHAGRATLRVFRNVYLRQVRRLLQEARQGKQPNVKSIII